MEIYYSEHLNFLQKEEVQETFADINFALLSGKHILRDEENKYIWYILDNEFDNFLHFYQTFYQLNLRKETRENQTFFFLDFYENSKGKLSDYQRHRELTERNIFYGIIFLNLFFDKHFEQRKRYNWYDIQDKIEKSEYSKIFTQFFFKNNPKTEASWQKVQDDFQKAIDEFDKISWTKWIDKDNFIFEIQVSIYRFIDLYYEEIRNIEQTIENYETNRRNKK